MAWETQPILRNDQGDPVPQQWNEETQAWEIATNVQKTQLTGSIVDLYSFGGELTITEGDNLRLLEITGFKTEKIKGSIRFNERGDFSIRLLGYVGSSVIGVTDEKEFSPTSNLGNKFECEIHSYENALDISNRDTKDITIQRISVIGVV